jgi:archaellum biogenesis ATPase FlaH
MSKSFDFGKMDKELSKIPGFELGSMLADNDFSEVDDWISTGNFLLNAQVSGSLFGGVPNTRSFGLMGDPGTGKSFLCLNIVREAQKKGYNVIYCDTEGAIDKTSALKFGIDANKLRYQPIQTVSQFQTFVANVLDMMKKSKSGGEDPKIMLIVDSLGMLSTDKELADAVKGHNAADMGSKAKELRKLFRVITLDLTAAKVPLIVTNHVYCLTAGHKVIMGDGSLKNIEDIRVDDLVQTLAGPKPVSETHSFGGQYTIKLTLENGQTIECTPNHKFMISEGWGEDESWKSANDLEPLESILYRLVEDEITDFVRILGKEYIFGSKTVYDITIPGPHHYLLENGVVSHNTGGGYMPTKESSGGDGPIFAMSVVSFLSKAQLKDGSGTKTGIIVTSNLKKSRFTIPEPVKFHISFANGMNPYVGLQDFVSWEACGIERGKYEEVKGPDGKKELVFKPSATSTRWGVRHLGKTIASTQLFTPEVFTEEVLRQLDENVIKPHFKLPDVVKDDFLDEIASDEEGED